MPVVARLGYLAPRLPLVHDVGQHPHGLGLDDQRVIDRGGAEFDPAGRSSGEVGQGHHIHGILGGRNFREHPLGMGELLKRRLVMPPSCAGRYPRVAGLVFQGALNDEREPVGQAAPVGLGRLLRPFVEFFADAEVSPRRHVIKSSAFTLPYVAPSHTWHLSGEGTLGVCRFRLHVDTTCDSCVKVCNMDTRPEQPPEGRLIADAANRLDLSIREAAKRAGISYGRWRQIVMGYQNVSPGVYGAVHAPAKTLAKMAHVVGVTPLQLAEAGREDAAVWLVQLAPPEPVAPEPEPGRPRPADDVEAVTTNVVLAATTPLERRIWAEIHAHPDGTPAEVIFADEFERLLWRRMLFTEHQRIREIAAYRSVQVRPMRPARGGRAERPRRLTGEHATPSQLRHRCRPRPWCRRGNDSWLRPAGEDREGMCYARTAWRGRDEETAGWLRGQLAEMTGRLRKADTECARLRAELEEARQHIRAQSEVDRILAVGLIRRRAVIPGL